MHLLSQQNLVRLIVKLAFVALVSIMPFVSQAFFSGAAAPVPVGGHAWSSTIGWISFSCESGGPNGENVCGTSDYQVVVQGDGSVTGYAWSSNIGWIRFGGLSAFPTGPDYTGVSAENARLVETSSGSGAYELHGWARACAGTLHPSDPYVSGSETYPNAYPTMTGNCSSMQSRPDGWDGWIALSGSTHNSAGAPDGGRFRVLFTETGATGASWAWGGPVVGWIDMRGLTVNPKSAVITLDPPCTVALGDATCDVRLEFLFNDEVELSDSPEINQTSPTFSNLYSGVTSGVEPERAMPVGQNTFEAVIDTNVVLDTKSVTISCVANASLLPSPGGSGVCECNTGYQPNAAGDACEEIPAITPVMEFTPSQSLIRKGDTVTFTIEVAGASPLCTISGPGIAGTDPISGIDGSEIADPTEFSYETTSLQNFARFTLACSGIFSDPITGEPITQEIRRDIRVIPTFQEQ